MIDAARSPCRTRRPRGMAEKKFTVYRTHHGPIVREADGKWVSVRLMQEPVKALTQSYMRTKARDYKAFRQTMELHTNSSNNTIFADADGDIAYFHGNFIPTARHAASTGRSRSTAAIRRPSGRACSSVDETPHLLNPPSGWLYNTNNWPWSAAGPSSPKKADYPGVRGDAAARIRARPARHPRAREQEGLHARLADRRGVRQLPARVRRRRCPPLVEAWDEPPATNPLKAKLAEQIDAAARAGI